MFKKIPKKYLFAMLLGAISQTQSIQAVEPTHQQIRVAEHAYHEQEQHHYTYSEAQKIVASFHKQSRNNFTKGIALLQQENNTQGSTKILSVFEYIHQRNMEHFKELNRFKKAAEQGDADNYFFHNIGLKAQTIQININAQRAMLTILANDVPNSDELLQKLYDRLRSQEKVFHNFIR